MPRKGFGEGKKRVQITLGDELLEKLDEFCSHTGMSRSAFIASCVAERLDTQRRVYEMLSKSLSGIIDRSMDD